METIYWTTKNGVKIDIDKMTIEHLRNTLKMIVRQSYRHSPRNIEEAFEAYREEQLRDIGFDPNWDLD